MRRMLWVAVVGLLAGVLPQTGVTAEAHHGRGADRDALIGLLESWDGPDTSFDQVNDASPCYGTSVADEADDDVLDIAEYGGSLSCGTNELTFIFDTHDDWALSDFFESYIRLDVDGDITNGCSEGDYFMYAVNQTDDDSDEIVAGVFSSPDPSCEVETLTVVGTAAVDHPEPDRLVVQFGRDLIGNPATIGHYGRLASPGEDNTTSDYAPDTGRIDVDTSPLADPRSAGTCVDDPGGDVFEREGDGTETPTDEVPAVDLEDACAYYGDFVEFDVRLPNLDFTSLGAGSGPAVLIDTDADGSAERVLRAIWNGLGFTTEVTDEEGAVVCAGEVRIRGDVMSIGDLGTDCVEDVDSFGVNIAMGALAEGDSVYVDRAGVGGFTTVNRTQPVDPDATGTDPATVEVDDPADGPQDGGLVRLFGPARIETSVAISEHAWPDGAAAVVLARQDVEADALAGAALATAINAPLVLTPSDGLTRAVSLELQRVLPDGGRVYILGGEAALGEQVIVEVQQLGYGTVRLAGPTRVETGLEIAREAAGFLESVDNILIADAFEFQWALIAGAAAGANNGVVVTTAASGLSADAQAFIDANPQAQVTAIGPGATQAAPNAESINGTDAYETAVRVARQFFPGATRAAVASGETFPDGLGGGAFAGSLDMPLLLSPQAQLSNAASNYLSGAEWNELYMMGGEAALAPAVENALDDFIG